MVWNKFNLFTFNIICNIILSTTKILVAVVAKCFWAFIHPVLEYCSPVWMSAATSHLSLFDRVVIQVDRLSSGSVSCDLWHSRRKVSSLNVFFKIDSLVDHPVRGLFSSAVCVEETNP